jgi:uncharacterized protein (TIGR01777 family)
MMRVVITGGTGLIGRALAADLSDQYDVVVLSRQAGPVSGLPPAVRVVQWDVKSADTWASLADGALAIINLAGAGIADGRWTAARKAAIINSRIQAGRAVVAAVEAASVKPRVVIQASAVGYYGVATRERPLTEHDPAGSDWLASVVQAWEPSTAAVEEMGVRRVIARIGVVLAADGGALPRMVAPFRFGAGGPLGSGEQWLSWIHLTDQVRALRFLLENEGASGPFNLTAPNPVQNRELANRIGTVLALPALLPAPAFALRLALGEMATMVLDGQRVMPHRLLDAGFRFRFSEVETALRDLL